MSDRSEWKKAHGPFGASNPYKEDLAVLPKSIQYNERYIFVVDRGQGYHLAFVSPEMLSRVKSEPVEPHWYFECGDERSLDAALRWFAVRRSLWANWGRLVTTAGRQVFSRHIAQLMADDPIAEVLGTMVNRDDDPCVMSMGQMLAGPTGLRTEILVQHRFKSAAARDLFFDWFATDRNSDDAGPLLNLAFEKGTDALSAILDDAAEALQSRRHDPVNRKKRRRVGA